MISRLEDIDNYETSKIDISEEKEDEEHSSCKDTIKLNEQGRDFSFLKEAIHQLNADRQNLLEGV